MKILALGGCGEMGHRAVKTLMAYDFVEHIVIADINQDKAQSAAEEFESRARPLKVDVSDNDALRKAGKKPLRAHQPVMFNHSGRLIYLKL